MKKIQHASSKDLKRNWPEHRTLEKIERPISPKICELKDGVRKFFQGESVAFRIGRERQVQFSSVKHSQKSLGAERP